MRKFHSRYVSLLKQTHKNLQLQTGRFYQFQKEILMGVHRLLVMDLPTFPEPATENPFSLLILNFLLKVSCFAILIFSSMSFNPFYNLCSPYRKSSKTQSISSQRQANVYYIHPRSKIVLISVFHSLCYNPNIQKKKKYISFLCDVN